MDVPLWLVIVKVVAAFALLMLITILLIWVERKVVADMQNRIGPNRAGPWGILQTLADGIKLFFKEQVTPREVELGVYALAPVLAVIPSFLIFLVIPIGAPVAFGETSVTLQVMDINAALLFFLAMSSMAVYAVVLAGWSSGSKYPLLGGVRASAQMISYEAAMGLALVPVIMFASARAAALGADVGIGTLSLATLVELQSGSFFGPIPAWFIFPQLVAFAIFFTAAVAEVNRAPFDLVEAEQELVGGYHTEYSGLRFALFFLAEYINMFNMSAIIATVFLGGWNGPTFGPFVVQAILPVVWFLVKVAVILFLFIWIRATLPRFRYDQLMTLGWKRLIPLGLVWLLLSTVVISFRQFGAPWA